ncbi:hypothetical protein [Curtobacterium sp. MCSS17_016]|uniref:hypothetical protein n=1 Tax=Curtobacterium sp. MCSS17_016 TaxID=2175644 RepID=UPI000DA956A0|nr:hypothetical protein [Curtobacterium sp. MCSS17_016]WIE80858.1 hypothetical protein DEJ19_020290 [Curtobacterium sp. MCSS17_016]
MPVQHNIAPPLTHLQLERAFDLITICRGEQDAEKFGMLNNARPTARFARREMFSALDEPNRATWRKAAGVYLIDNGEVINWGEAVMKYTDKHEGDTPTREQMFRALEQVARHQ